MAALYPCWLNHVSFGLNRYHYSRWRGRIHGNKTGEAAARQGHGSDGACLSQHSLQWRHGETSCGLKPEGALLDALHWQCLVPCSVPREACVSPPLYLFCDRDRLKNIDSSTIIRPPWWLSVCVCYQEIKACICFPMYRLSADRGRLIDWLIDCFKSS